MIKQLKYKHIYLPTILFIWLGLFLDSSYLASMYSNSQWLTNLLVIPVFIWTYLKTSKQVKQLMLFGLVLATVGEIVFSLLLGMYTYRLENLPLYIPFGHTIIYASVYYIVKEPLIQENKEGIIKLLYFSIIIYSSIWLIFASDLFGFLCMLVILWIFHRRPHTKLFFLIMYFMIVYLELLGTYYNCWHWPNTLFNFIDFIPSANPPSAISVFYFGFDAGCLWLYKRYFPNKWQRFNAIKEYSSKN